VKWGSVAGIDEKVARKERPTIITNGALTCALPRRESCAVRGVPGEKWAEAIEKAGNLLHCS
jgi:hypothetical protein